MIVYTAIFGGYDTLQPLPEGVTGVCFTDAQIAARGWELRQSQFADADPRLRARHHKCMSHILFPGETTLWIDGNILIDKLPPEREFATFHHKMGVGSIKAEIRECLRCGKFVRAERLLASRRLNRWNREGFKDDGGHPETCVLMRGPGVAAFNELWWELVKQVRRDQTSCDYAAWKTGLKWEPWDGTVVKNEYVKQVKHEPPPVQAAKERIFYFVPYDKRGLGVAYNECCRIVPAGAWACLMDADVMLFPPNFGDIVQDAIAARPDIDVWTTYATRVNCNENIVCPGGVRDEEQNLVLLRQKSVDFAKKRAGKIKDLPRKELAGYFMLFRKSLWEKVPFPERSLRGARGATGVMNIDIEWSRAVKAHGGKFGIIPLLAVHYYTLGVDRGQHIRSMEGNVTRPPALDVPTGPKWGGRKIRLVPQ